MSKIRTLASTYHLIYILQSTRNGEPVFLLALGLALFGLYHCLHPSGHALNQVSKDPLGILSDPTFTYSKAYVHQQEGPHKCWALAWGVATDTQ